MYGYYGNLKRVKSVIDGQTIYNVYDLSGALVHIETGDDPNTANKNETGETDYVSGPQGTLARIKNGIVTYLHPDHLGSAQAGTDNSGAIIWREQYTPFGEELQSPAANDNLAGFTGHIKDKATGLNYMQARYYDPVIGRFLSADPVGFLDTGNPNFFNRYAYTFNDPVNLIDPNGESCTSADGTTTCTPEDTSFKPFSFPTPEGFEDFESTDSNFHQYRFEDDVGQGGSEFGDKLANELVKSPTNDDNAATETGALNDVGPLINPFSGKDEVKSFTTQDGIANVTEKNHVVRSGFVARKIAPNGNGGFKIVTIGEGNNRLQTLPGANGAARRFWSKNATRIANRARK